jgi:hypothetical protein
LIAGRSRGREGDGKRAGHDRKRNDFAGMQQYGNYAVALRLAEAAASAKANDSTIPPR